MTRTMWDGINSDAASIAKKIKPGDLVAYYIDGWAAWTPEEIELFQDFVQITITVLGNPADVADCETGDLTPASAANWARKQRERGYFRPTIYGGLANMPNIRAATGNLVMGKHWDSWVAHYDNDADSDYAGEAAKQYKTESFDDVSAVYDPLWPHRHDAANPPVVTHEGSAPTQLWPASQTLKLNSKGNAVMAMQHAFHNSGIPGVRGIDYDGIFGGQTQTAVRNFQAHAGLPNDGIAGPSTRKAMVNASLLSASGAALG